MAEPLAFLPYHRRSAPTEDLVHEAPDPARGRQRLDLQLTDGRHDATVAATFVLPGPADVVGLRPGAVRAMVPRPGETRAEEENCVFVEFAAEDLPWRYGLPTQDPLGPVPWCVLVVGTPEDLLVAGGRATLGADTQTAHDLGRVRNWVHVQRRREDAGTPGSGVARVLSPAELESNRDYVAALVVPWHDDGSKAWPAPVVDVRCLHAWRFRTGPEGSFASLARQLHAAGPDGTPVGAVEVHLPGGATVEVPGALTTLGFSLEPPEPGSPVRDHDLLEPALDPQGRPIVGSPGYGGPWLGHDAVRTAVGAARDDDAGQWAWPVQVNADLRMRVAAGVGLQAGIDLQEEIVAAASRQWGPANAARDLVHGLALGLEARRGIWERRLPRDRDERLVVLGPAAGRISTDDRPPEGAADGRSLAWALARPAAGRMPFPALLLGPRLAQALGRPAVAAAGGAAALVGAAADARPEPGRPAEEPDPADADGGHLDALSASAGVPAIADGELLGRLRVPAFDDAGYRERAPLDRDALDGLLTDLLDGGAARARVVGRIRGLAPATPLGPVEDCPDLDLPAWRYLRDRARHWLLPGADALEEGAVAALRTCPEFVEALLLGLNHRAVGELDWRGHPVRPGCTPLRRFWDRAPAAGRADDITPVRDWVAGSRLGDHIPGGAHEQLVVVVRSPLFRLYPRTLLYLAPTGAPPDGSPWTRGTARLDEPVWPRFVAQVTDDLTLFAFALDPARVAAHWVVVEEVPEGIRFLSRSGAPDPTPDNGAEYARVHLRRPIRVLLQGAGTVVP